MPATTGPTAELYPEAFMGRVAPVSRYEPYPVWTGSAFSSHQPASTWFHNVFVPAPVYVSNINVVKSMNAVVPGATSQNSSGSEAYSYAHFVTFFKRQDWSANSTNLTTVASASLGITGTMSYSSSSQSFGLSWVTNTTGGTTAFSTTSTDGNWSSFATGPKVMGIPWVGTLSAGEYFVAHGHSSTTATSNSNVTLLSFSNLHVVPTAVVTVGVLGASVTNAASSPMGIGNGIASAVTTNTTMPATVITANTVNFWVQNFSNA